MTSRVLKRDSQGNAAVVAYDESADEREERIRASGQSARRDLQVTYGQARLLAKARRARRLRVA